MWKLFCLLAKYIQYGTAIDIHKWKHANHTNTKDTIRKQKTDKLVKNNNDTLQRLSPDIPSSEYIPVAEWKRWRRNSLVFIDPLVHDNATDSVVLKNNPAILPPEAYDCMYLCIV